MNEDHKKTIHFEIEDAENDDDEAAQSHDGEDNQNGLVQINSSELEDS